MITLTDERQKNLAFAREINRETRANPASPYVGKYIGVLHQKVVAVADTLEELDRQLDALGDTAHEAASLEASADYDRVYMIWEWR